jgi:hypothetical protein
VKGSCSLGWLLSETYVGSGEDTGPLIVLEGSAIIGVTGWASVILLRASVVGDFPVIFACSRASL